MVISYAIITHSFTEKDLTSEDEKKVKIENPCSQVTHYI